MMNNYQNYSSGSTNGHHPGMRMDSRSAGHDGRHGSFHEKNDYSMPFSRHVSFDQSARNGSLPTVPHNGNIVSTQKQELAATVGNNHSTPNLEE